ncbi:MAG TPA: thiamine diphosphokinase, partial [Deltaproteobacteria bacterium]|nr:thiamine diphosphokinase [Deltaproteobacteria bacterium]
MMNILILANGNYGDIQWYRQRIASFTKVICADGGTRMACLLGLVPDLVVGDMDSTDSRDRITLEGAGARFIIYPKEKDLTDIQIAFEHALSLQA